jgi:hypothetical protein
MEKGKQFKSVESWEKMARHAKWVGGQASKLNPGSSAAESKRRQGKKFKARGKKVIRPRIPKYHNPDNREK